MSQTHGMIEPFVEQQVREGVISYGVSSYGYDMRVTDQFKVFTNVYNALVDPKNFNPNSFVDIQAEVCDIPPNSFALTRSVEYFRIPRNVLCIVMGKSTYARCFRGDTQVALTDGTTVSLEQMAEQSLRGHRFDGYSYGAHGHAQHVPLLRPRYTGQDALVSISLTNGKVVHCTPNHEWLLADGTRRAASQLRPDDALCPCQPVVSAQGGVSPKVAQIADLPGLHDVYCLTVANTANFALDAGVFVANCGIIVNVTPLEPGWEGFVTIEISNTAPLPARIYANEGIGQVVFLESDEACAISYADKKGKYHQQQDIALPRIG